MNLPIYLEALEPSKTEPSKGGKSDDSERGSEEGGSERNYLQEIEQELIKLWEELESKT